MGRSKKRVYSDSESDSDKENDTSLLAAEIKKIGKRLKKIEKKRRNKRCARCVTPMGVSHDKTPSRSTSEDREVYMPSEEENYSDELDLTDSAIVNQIQPIQGDDPPGLDPKILSILGDKIPSTNCKDLVIQDEVVNIWSGILQNGLPEEELKEISLKHQVPKNFSLAKPPILNENVKASLNSSNINRDNRIAKKQLKISSCLSALGKSISFILDKKIKSEDDLNFLENMSDVGRLLADLHHDESSVRRTLVLTEINEDFKKVLGETKIGDFLFGDNLQEKINQAKSLDRSSKELKSHNVDKKTNKSIQSKNWRNPSRAQAPQWRGSSRGGRKEAPGQTRNVRQVPKGQWNLQKWPQKQQGQWTKRRY